MVCVREAVYTTVHRLRCNGVAVATVGTRSFKMALERLSRDAFELGLYDRKEMPDGGADE